jgi:hypothetical protein
VRLDCLPGTYAVARRAAAAPVPSGLLETEGFVSVTRTPDEISVVAPARALDRADYDRFAGNGRLFRVAGPLDLSMTGVMAGLAQALALAGISIFPVATHDTDYILVPARDAARAAEAWRAAGHSVDGI